MAHLGAMAQSSWAQLPLGAMAHLGAMAQSRRYGAPADHPVQYPPVPLRTTTVVQVGVGSSTGLSEAASFAVWYEHVGRSRYGARTKVVRFQTINKQAHTHPTHIRRDYILRDYCAMELS